MAKQKEFRLQLIESKTAQPPGPREGVAHTDLDVTPDLILAALKATAGADELLSQIPQFDSLTAWREIAYFSVCQKRGHARYLDIWDSDQFDGFTDMERCLRDCRVWFSAGGYEFWGSGQTKSGRVNCYFHAPSDGDYLCTASLQSYPAAQQSMVECLIDDSSFGPLPFIGTIHQPHPCSLSAGGHHFRIRQLQGSFFFLSLVVHRV